MNLEILFGNIWFFLAMLAWVLPWKGVALWRAARLGDKWWFVALLILNTLAILEILYIYWISKRKGLGGGSGVVSLRGSSGSNVSNKPATRN